MIEWMTQAHYVDSVQDNSQIDPLFKSMLKHHWLEESQHAKLDTRMVEYIAERMDADAIAKSVDAFFEIGGLLDEGLQQQVRFELEALELATGRTFTEEERKTFIDVQLQANRWTFIGSGMVHPKFLGTMGRLGAAQRLRIEAAAPVFA
jgi:hypothetical protein